MDSGTERRLATVSILRDYISSSSRILFDVGRAHGNGRLILGVLAAISGFIPETGNIDDAPGWIAFSHPGTILAGIQHDGPFQILCVFAGDFLLI